MKLAKAKKLSPLLSSIFNYRWPFIISILICASITAITRYTFHLESYSSATVLGLASGFSVIAVIWLTYSVLRLK